MATGYDTFTYKIGAPIETKWDDPRGVPYQDFPGQARRFFSPLESSALSQAQGADPRLRTFAEKQADAPQGDIWREPGEWNTKTGQFDRGGIRWGWWAPAAVGAVVGSAAVAPHLGGLLGAHAAAGAAAGGGSTAGTTAGGSSMGFLSALKGLGKEFLMDTGKDALGNVLNTRAGQVGQTAGSIEAGRAQGLVTQAKLQQQQDELALIRSRDALAAPGKEASNSVRGDILANGQDAGFSGELENTGLPSYIHVPKMTGGLRPSMFSNNTRQLGGEMSRKALLNSLSGKDVPELTPLPESNAFDTGLQGTAYLGSFLNALKGGSHGGDASVPPAGTFPGDFAGPGAEPPPDMALDHGLDDPIYAEWLKSQNQVPA